MVRLLVRRARFDPAAQIKVELLKIQEGTGTPNALAVVLPGVKLADKAPMTVDPSAERRSSPGEFWTLFDDDNNFAWVVTAVRRAVTQQVDLTATATDGGPA
jgi:hypothetical protein